MHHFLPSLCQWDFCQNNKKKNQGGLSKTGVDPPPLCSCQRELYLTDPYKKNTINANCQQQASLLQSSKDCPLCSHEPALLILSKFQPFFFFSRLFLYISLKVLLSLLVLQLQLREQTVNSENSFNCLMELSTAYPPALAKGSSRAGFSEPCPSSLNVLKSRWPLSGPREPDLKKNQVHKLETPEFGLK